MKDATRTPRQIKRAANKLAKARAAFRGFYPESEAERFIASQAFATSATFDFATARALQTKCLDAETAGVAGGRDAADSIGELIARRSA